LSEQPLSPFAKFVAGHFMSGFSRRCRHSVFLCFDRTSKRRHPLFGLSSNRIVQVNISTAAT